jgi:hypothetical protein
MAQAHPGYPVRVPIRRAGLPWRRCVSGMDMHRFLNGWKYENNDEKITFRSGCP